MTLNALLEELGCNKSGIDEFILMGEENRYDAQQRLLRKKRQQLPDAIHTIEKKIGSIDFLLSEIRSSADAK